LFGTLQGKLRVDDAGRDIDALAKEEEERGG